MSPTRAIALRRIAATRATPCATVPVAARQVRWASNKPEEGDLGGPGGQEAIPPRSGASQSWPTLAAIGGVGLLVAGYLVHLTGKPKGQTKPAVEDLEKLAGKIKSNK